MAYLPGSEAQQRKKVLEYAQDVINDKRGTHRFLENPEAYLRARKQRQNRDSAKKSRETKKDTMDDLEELVAELREQLEDLRQENRRLVQENQGLKLGRPQNEIMLVRPGQENQQQVAATQTSSSLGAGEKNPEINSQMMTCQQNVVGGYSAPAEPSHAEQLINIVECS